MFFNLVDNKIKCWFYRRKMMCVISILFLLKSKWIKLNVLEEVMKIKEIIVVEGWDDIVVIKCVVDVDIIEINGLVVNEEIIEKVKLV